MACVTLGVIFLLTLFVIWIFGGESWNQSTLLTDATVFGAVAVVAIGLVGIIGGKEPPTPEFYHSSGRPVEYIR